MYYVEAKQIEKDYKGAKLQLIGGLLTIAGGIIMMVGQHVSDGSVKVKAYYDEKGNLIEDSVKYY